MKVAVDPVLRASEGQYYQSGAEVPLSELKYEMIFEQNLADL